MECGVQQGCLGKLLLKFHARKIALCSPPFLSCNLKSPSIFISSHVDVVKKNVCRVTHGGPNIDTSKRVSKIKAFQPFRHTQTPSMVGCKNKRLPSKHCLLKSYYGLSFTYRNQTAPRLQFGANGGSRCRRHKFQIGSNDFFFNPLPFKAQCVLLHSASHLLLDGMGVCSALMNTIQSKWMVLRRSACYRLKSFLISCNVIYDTELFWSCENATLPACFMTITIITKHRCDILVLPARNRYNVNACPVD